MTQSTTQNQDDLVKKRISFLSKTFNVSAFLTLFTTLMFAFLVFLNSHEVFRNFIFNFFKQIPYVGQPLHLVIKSMNLIDLNTVYQQVILPLLSLEIVYYSIFLLIFEILILVFKGKFMKDSRNYFSFFLITIIVGTLIMFKQVNLIVMPIAQGSALLSRNSFIRILLLIQLISILAIAYNYHKLGQFDLKEVINTNLTKKMIKIGSIVTMTALLLFSSLLLVANTQVDHVKEAVAVDYVLDFKPTADGMLHVELPPKLVLTSKLMGFNLPKTIEGGALLQYFVVSEVNIGEVVSQFALDFIDNLAYQYLVIPMSNGFVTVLLILLLVVYNLYKFKIPFSPLSLDAVQFILAFIISFMYLSKFGIIMSMFGALILVGSGLNLYMSFNESNTYLKLKQTLSKSKQ